METAYCCKCRSKKTMSNGKIVATKNGRKCLKGTCSTCSTKMCKFVKG